MSAGAIRASSSISVRELKDNVNLPRAQQATRKDGLDQIYVEGSDGNKYAAYGRSIENAASFKPGDEIQLTTSDGRQVKGVVSFVDNEATSAAEGAAKPFEDASAWIATTGAGAVGALGGFGLGISGAFGAAIGGTAMVGMGAILATAAAGGVIVAGLVGGGTAAYGAVTAHLNTADDSRMKELLK